MKLTRGDTGFLLALSITLLATAACAPAEIVIPEEAASQAVADRITLAVATPKPEGFIELDVVRVVATVHRKDGGEVSGGSVTWTRDSELGIQPQGPRSADIRLVPGTNTISASFQKPDGSIISASIQIPALRAKQVVVLWESDGTVTTIVPPVGFTVILPRAINDRGEIVGTVQMIGVPDRAWIWSKSDGFRFIGTGSEHQVQALDINNEGIVVGFRQIGPVVSGFRWSEATGFVPLGGVNPTIATGITDSGLATGIVDFKAVRWDRNGASKELALTPGGKCSGAIAIGSTGYVAGWVGASFDDGWCLHASPVIWSPDGSPQVIRDCSNELECGYQLYDVNANGEAIGSGPSGKPFRWTREDGFRQLLGDANGSAVGLNDRGEVVGAVNYPDALPIIWNREGAARLLPLPAGQHTGTARAINNKGDVVGVVK